MSELGLPNHNSSTLDTGTEAAPMGGAMLKAAREAAGLHIGALAVTLKVPVKKLEALEADRMDLLPDAVFVRALAASVCRTLRIDAAPVLARLPVTLTPRLRTVESGINAPFRVPGVDPGSSIRDRLTSPLAIAVLLMLVGALILVFAPPLDRFEQMLGLAQGSSPGQPGSVSQPSLTAPPVEVGQTEPTAVSEVKESVGLGVAPALVLTTAPVAAASIALPAPLPAPPPVVDAAGNVVIRARGPSWVEVTDAAGVVQLRKMMSAGEGVGVSGKRPLSVVVGRADAVDVTVSGKPYELVNVSRDKVARFEVK
ncbi:helix-turn-helix domain-containing protein [Rhodoferax sp.]|uniref:helix-turn-helix domain-containing protein n=1 Tax=Rhodoferax sp. TaxID=50421 RepID=UPI00274E8BB0|nr:DUF4115 domain-containing protein [Rhodoferax sp.]